MEDGSTLRQGATPPGDKQIKQYACRRARAARRVPHPPRHRVCASVCVCAPVCVRPLAAHPPACPPTRRLPTYPSATHPPTHPTRTHLPTSPPPPPTHQPTLRSLGAEYCAAHPRSPSCRAELEQAQHAQQQREQQRLVLGGGEGGGGGARELLAA